MSKSPSLRRIQADIRELTMNPSDRYHAAPLENDMFEWHFTIRGADGTDFEDGVYHGRILLPADYPFKPPNIVFLTPSGRFETNIKVCLSFSAYHPELWQPAWGIRLILEALISFLPTKADGAIGALDWTSEERRKLAKKSVEFSCSNCGNCAMILKKIEGSMNRFKRYNDENSVCMFRKEISKLHAFQEAAENGYRNNEDLNSKYSTGFMDKVKNKDRLKNKNFVDKSTGILKKETRCKINDPTCEITQMSKSVTRFVNKNVSLIQINVTDHFMGEKDVTLSMKSVNQTCDLIDQTFIIERDTDSSEKSKSEESTIRHGSVKISENKTDISMERITGQHKLLDSSWFSDSILNASILILLVSLYLLYQRLHALIENLKEFE